MAKEGAFTQILMEFKPSPKSRYFDMFKERFLEAKKKGIAKEADEVLTGIGKITTDYDAPINVTHIEVSPAVFPFNEPLLKEMNLQKNNPLSTITHFYTGPSPDRPTHVLVQKRSKATKQGHYEIQPASAGFIKYSQWPIDNILSEFEEEVADSALGKKCNLKLKDVEITYLRKGKFEMQNAENFRVREVLYLDLWKHYMGELENPGLSGILYAHSSKMQKLPIVKNVKQLDDVSEKQEETFEVSGLALVPVGDFAEFWSDCYARGRVFGPSLATSEFFDRFFLKKFK